MRQRRSTVIALASAALVLAGCDGVQSTLVPAGRASEQIAELFWWLAAGGVFVWLVVIGLAIYAIRIKTKQHNRRRAAIFIIGGGAVVPSIVLVVYLIFAFSMMPDLIKPAPEGSLRVHVSGEQWWWRVNYPLADGGSVELANEVRMPVGEPVEFILRSPDVIHSFWIPSLGGKIDMIPGRITRLTLEATRTGVFRGACAEYCGESHALMSFYAVVMEQEEFDSWLTQQAQPAEAPESALAQTGREHFLSNGCGACHAVRGTEADGDVGPDLTHVGGRVSLGAAVLPNETDDFFRWIAHTEQLKPGVHMPSFGMLPDEDLRAMAAYLEGLK